MTEKQRIQLSVGVGLIIMSIGCLIILSSLCGCSPTEETKEKKAGTKKAKEVSGKEKKSGPESGAQAGEAVLESKAVVKNSALKEKKSKKKSGSKQSEVKADADETKSAEDQEKHQKSDENT